MTAILSPPIYPSLLSAKHASDRISQGSDSRKGVRETNVINVKNAISCALIVLLTVVSAWPTMANAQQVTRTLAVAGEGRVSKTPDLFHFSVAVAEQGLHVSKLNQSVSKTSKRIITLLLEQGIPEKDIQALHVQLEPWYEYQNNRRTQKGFQLNRTIKVKVRQVAKFDQLIDKVLKAGANTVDGFRYSLSQQRSSYLDALDLAIVDAKLRAERLASSMQSQVGKVISIRERGVSHEPMPRMEKTMAFSDSVGTYVPGQVDVTAHVDVVFELVSR